MALQKFIQGRWTNMNKASGLPGWARRKNLNDITVHAGDMVKFSVGERSTSGVDLYINLTTPIS
jgi:hypothetical protein